MITVFTTNNCVYCGTVKKYLDMKGLEYVIAPLDDQPELRQQLFEITGAMTVPITNISGQWIVGWSVNKFNDALAEGVI